MSTVGGIWNRGEVYTCTYIHINAIAEALEEEKCEVLHTFHSLTGCDTSSTFNERGEIQLGMNGNAILRSKRPAI